MRKWIKPRNLQFALITLLIPSPCFSQAATGNGVIKLDPALDSIVNTIRKALEIAPMKLRPPVKTRIHP